MIRVIPYPPSTALSGLEWLAEATRYPGTGTDMHWWTWGADDALYVAEDDGQNFGRAYNFAHLLRVTGLPPHHEIVEVTDFPGLKHPEFAQSDERVRRWRYICGALAVGSRLYIAVYDYDMEEPGKERAFLGALSRHAGIVGFMISDDYGVTWTNVPDERYVPERGSYFLGPRFAGLAFVGFGPGYTGVPPELDGHVYAISNDENWESGNHVFLARVAKDQILDRSAWEFYAGADEAPAANESVWTREEAAARPILSDPGHVGHPTMTYNRGLDRFLLAFGWTCPGFVETCTLGRG